jgi:hypothetical protein
MLGIVRVLVVKLDGDGIQRRQVACVELHCDRRGSLRLDTGQPRKFQAGF